MRIVFVVTYDICDPRRLRKVYETLCDFGDHLQLSVFRCTLADVELVRLKALLRDIIHPGEDQVLFVRVGPEGGASVDRAFFTLGRAYEDDERGPAIV